MPFPSPIGCAKDAWTRVDSGISRANLWILNREAEYYYTYRALGDPPPGNELDAIQLPQPGMLFELNEYVDIYVLCKRDDGLLRVDVLDSADSTPIVPRSFTKATTMQLPFDIAQGSLNKMRLRPQVMNEHVDSSREIQAVVTAGRIVGQIFKASADNINSIYLTLSSAAGQILEDFDGYRNSSELQTVWVASNNLALLVATPGDPLKQSMQLPSGSVSGGNSWIRTIPPTDFTDFLGVITFSQDELYSNFKVSVSVSDGTNTKRFLLVSTSPNTQQSNEVDINAMTEDDPLNPVDDSAITSIGFRIEDKNVGSLFYVDEILQIAPAGSVDLKLWDMGPDLPSSGVDALDDGTQYTTLGDITDTAPFAVFNIELVGGTRLMHLHRFIAGVAEEIPGNVPLTIGNYYALTLHFADTEVNVWGVDTSYAIDYYADGYAFTAPDEATPISQIGQYSDLMFAIFSTQDVFVYHLEASANAEPNGNAEFHATIEDKNMGITTVVHTHGIEVPQSNSIDLTYRPANLPKGGKFELDYGDDASDDVTKINVSMSYVYKPPTVNG